MGFTLSATAPQFLPEQERQERETLSEEEKAKIQHDLYDNDDDNTCMIEETPELISEGLNQIASCIDKMSPRDKKAYVEALTNAPDLVQTESDPVTFLRCEGFQNAEAAAVRLVEYWKQRKSLFGKQAYEPMKLDGGALTDEDRSTMKHGHWMILPRSTAGHAVLFFNGAPPEEYPRSSVLRVWFYLLHVVTRDENVQRNGYIIINSIKGFNVSKHFDRMLGKKSFELVKTAMPAQLRTSHACMGHSMPAIQVVAPSSKQMAGKHIRLRAVMHAGSDSEMITKMEDYGLAKQNICHHVGGDFTLQDFLEWIETQRTLEEEQQ